jgi:hypothetical protein
MRYLHAVERMVRELDADIYVINDRYTLNVSTLRDEVRYQNMETGRFVTRARAMMMVRAGRVKAQ